jgi:hypothetical protein
MCKFPTALPMIWPTVVPAGKEKDGVTHKQPVKRQERA